MSKNQAGNLFTDWFLRIFLGRTRRVATLADHNEECAAFRVWGAEVLVTIHGLTAWQMIHAVSG